MAQFVITGARGLLGSDLAPALVSEFGSDAVAALSHAELDITDERSIEVALARHQPKWIFNTAAYTNVDKAESEREKAHHLNVTGPRLLAAAAQRHGARLFHFSTDQVFDGQNHRPWLETDTPRPLNVYAQTKWEGETEVLKHPEHLVMRVQWLYGRQKDRFTLLRDKETFSPFSDQIGSPTWASHVGMVITKLLKRPSASGLFHFSYDDHASWAEVFQFVKETMGYRVKLEPKRTAEVSLPAKRPLYAALSNRKLLQALGEEQLGSWKLALATFLSGTRF